MQEWRRAKYFDVGPDILLEGEGRDKPVVGDEDDKTGEKIESGVLQDEDDDSKKDDDVSEGKDDKDDSDGDKEDKDAVEEVQESIKAHHANRHKRVARALFKRFITDDKRKG